MGAPVIRSIYFSQSEILDAIEALHAPEGIDVDVTYGNGGFYSGRKQPRHKFDIEPLHEGVLKSCSTSIPLRDESAGSVMFDPPFLTYVKGARTHKDGAVRLTARFGGYWTYSELEAHYIFTIREAHRILTNKGILVIKCQDIIHNHKMHCTHAMVIDEAAEAGFRLRDLFVLAAKHRMPSPQRGQQRHARIFHNYFLVFEKTRSVRSTKLFALEAAA